MGGFQHLQNGKACRAVPHTLHQTGRASYARCTANVNSAYSKSDLVPDLHSILTVDDVIHQYWFIDAKDH